MEDQKIFENRFYQAFILYGENPENPKEKQLEIQDKKRGTKVLYKGENVQSWIERLEQLNDMKEKHFLCKALHGNNKTTIK
jgi:hypothetical protein